MLTLHKQLATAKTPHEKNILQSQIKAADKEIDQLVYELYGLTKDEIKIVEGTSDETAPAEVPKATTKEDSWYFAYGSNLSVNQKEERTGSIRFSIPCRLPGYRFAFNKRRGKGPIYANVVPDENSEVWGVIYLCNQEAMAEMDRREGVATGDYSRQRVEVLTDTDEKVAAEAYIAGPDCICPEAAPSEEYLQKILTGAREHGLPQDYIQRIETLGRQ